MALRPGGAGQRRQVPLVLGAGCGESGSLAEKIQNSFEKRAEDIAQAEAVGARIDKRLIGRIGQMLETGKKEPAPSKQMTLEEVRKRYPEYDDIPDDELTAALKKKGILK